uniref:Uncharacterized protein n=1 Tax=Lotharella oceanica TaxID=641309 RepID=A0A7S2TSX0_9EUKA|mmetsp:Transcript_25585/g.47715  ORF Transcript_25585/g.47715 Transcript_25585/m.47715 type:complete len:157 (+) Transcript_25585:233-703(+)
MGACYSSEKKIELGIAVQEIKYVRRNRSRSEAVRACVTPTYATPTYIPPPRQRHTYTMGIVPKLSPPPMTPRHIHQNTESGSSPTHNNPIVSPLAKTETPRSSSNGGSTGNKDCMGGTPSKENQSRGLESGMASNTRRKTSGPKSRRYLQTRRRTT